MAGWIGIDLGASRTKLAYLPVTGNKPELLRFGPQRCAYIPSLFHFPADGSPIQFGFEAEAALRLTPNEVISLPKHRLNDPNIWVNDRCAAPTELLTLALTTMRQLAARDIEYLTGQLPSGVVLTVPTSFDCKSVDVMTASALAAGFEHIEVQEEPVAAARAWQAQASIKVDRLIVVNGGGYSVTWAYLCEEQGNYRLSSSCLPGGLPFGGNVIELKLFEDLRSKFDKHSITVDHSQIHLALANLCQIKEAVEIKESPSVLWLDDIGFNITKETVQSVGNASFVSPVVEGLRVYAEHIVRATGDENLPPVLLTGGSAQLPQLRGALEKLGFNILTWPQAENASVLGTLQIAPALASELSPSSKLGRYEDGEAAFESGDYSSAYNIFLVLAEQGQVDAQNYLGLMYHEGLGVPKDSVQAVVWYCKAAEQGLAVAQFNLGLMYYEGQGVPKDSDQAVAWFRKAAEQGRADAQNYLGRMYHEGLGVPKDSVQAVTWYRKAAEQGLAVAQLSLGITYHHGLGVPKNYVEAVIWVRKAAEQRLAGAQNYLGLMYHEGLGAPKDYVQAVAWYRRAAEQGSAVAQYKLGFMYYEGQGVPKDSDQAVAWFRKAAEQGRADAQNYLGRMYHEGLGVPKDYVQAVAWYRRAAEQGLAVAQYKLGFMYHYGKGVAQDHAQANAWYSKAAEQGNVEALVSIGELKVGAFFRKLF